MESTNPLASDSVLAPEISPSGGARVTRLSEASSVLVTGATGFLGSFLLDKLLRNTEQSTRFYCLVRNRGSGHGNPGDRVFETLSSTGCSASPWRAGLSLSWVTSPDHRWDWTTRDTRSWQKRST